MDVVRSLGVVVGLAIGLVAQAAPAEKLDVVRPLAGAAPTVARAIRCVGFERYELPDAPATQTPAHRCAQVLTAALAVEPERPCRLQGATAREAVIVAAGTLEQLELVQRAVDALGEARPLHARLACSVLLVPKGVPAAQRLTKATTHLDDAATARLLRAAVKEGGSLHNLPEVHAAPLTPFAVRVGKLEEGAPGRTKREGDHAGARGRPLLELAGEMVPLGEQRVAVSFLLQRHLPGMPELRAPRIEWKSAHRLQAGDNAVAVYVGEHFAMILLVRCTELAAAPLVR